MFNLQHGVWARGVGMSAAVLALFVAPVEDASAAPYCEPTSTEAVSRTSPWRWVGVEDTTLRNPGSQPRVLTAVVLHPGVWRSMVGTGPVGDPVPAIRTIQRLAPAEAVSEVATLRLGETVDATLPPHEAVRVRRGVQGARFLITQQRLGSGCQTVTRTTEVEAVRDATLTEPAG